MSTGRCNYTVAVGFVKSNKPGTAPVGVLPDDNGPFVFLDTEDDVFKIALQNPGTTRDSAVWVLVQVTCENGRARHGRIVGDAEVVKAWREHFGQGNGNGSGDSTVGKTLIVGFVRPLEPGNDPVGKYPEDYGMIVFTAKDANHAHTINPSNLRWEKWKAYRCLVRITGEGKTVRFGVIVGGPAEVEAEEDRRENEAHESAQRAAAERQREKAKRIEAIKAYIQSLKKPPRQSELTIFIGGDKYTAHFLSQRGESRQVGGVRYTVTPHTFFVTGPLLPTYGGLKVEVTFTDK